MSRLLLVWFALSVGACASPPSADVSRPPPAAEAPLAPSESAPVASVLPPVEGPQKAPEPEPDRARFLSVGDVIFGRRVQKVIDEKGDLEHPFRPMAKLYEAVDLTFANLENPFFSGKKPNTTPKGKRYAVLWAKPEHAKTLAKYKFSAVSLANNHAMDQDMRGLEETLSTLDAAGIAHTGVGKDLAQAWKPMIVDVRGIKIGFVGASFASKNDMGISKNNFVARIEDETRLTAACKEARGSSHFVVVTFHAGDEHKFAPNAKQKAFARAAVRAGADVVIGGHPHVVQPAEKLDGVWVFYSIGNYIFDQAADDNREAIAIEIALIRKPLAERAEIETLRIHPVWIEESAPRPADEPRARRIFERLGNPPSAPVAGGTARDIEL